MITLVCIAASAVVIVGGAYVMVHGRREEARQDALTTHNEVFAATLVWTQDRGFHHRETNDVEDEAAD